MRIKSMFKQIVYFIGLALSSNLVSAAPDMDNFINIFKTAGEFLQKLFQNEYAVFGIAVVAFTILLYNLFVPLIGKIPVFSGDGGGASKYGRIIAFCLSLLSTSGIFGVMYVTGGITSPREIINNFLGPYATFAGIAVALLIFGIIYFGFKDLDPSDAWKRGLWGTGAFLIAVGTLLARPFFFQIGWLIVLIMLLFMLFRSGKSSLPESGGGSSSGGENGVAGDKKKQIKLRGKCKGSDYPGKPLKGIAGITVQAIDEDGNAYDCVSGSTMPSGKFTIIINNVESPVAIESIRDKNNPSKNFTPNSAEKGDTEYNSPGSVFPMKLLPGNTYDKYNKKEIVMIVKTGGKRVITGKVFELGNPSKFLSGHTVVAYCYTHGHYYSNSFSFHGAYYSSPSGNDGSYRIEIDDSEKNTKFAKVYVAVQDYEDAGAFDSHDYVKIKGWWDLLRPKTGYISPFTWNDSSPKLDVNVGYASLSGIFKPKITSSDDELGKGELKGEVERTV
jgi:hypothetical protein